MASLHEGWFCRKVRVQVTNYSLPKESSVAKTTIHLLDWQHIWNLSMKTSRKIPKPSNTGKLSTRRVKHPKISKLQRRIIKFLTLIVLRVTAQSIFSISSFLDENNTKGREAVHCGKLSMHRATCRQVSELLRRLKELSLLTVIFVRQYTDRNIIIFLHLSLELWPQTSYRDGF